MGSFDYSLHTDADPARVVAYLSDLTNLVHFVREIESVAPEGPGYRVTLDRGLLMPDMVVDYTVATEGDTVVATGSHSSIDAVDRWQVTPSGEGADVRYHGTYELKGIAKASGPLAQLAGNWRAKGIAETLADRLDELAAA